MSGEALKNPILYLIAVLLFFGGAGIWYPIAAPAKTISVDAIATFTIATVSPLAADLMIRSGEFDETINRSKRILFLLLFSVAWSGSFIALVREGHRDAWLFAIAGMVVSLIAWLMLNVLSKKFEDVSNTASIGGDNPNTGKLNGKGLDDD